jgi:hypothetical protein
MNYVEHNALNQLSLVFCKSKLQLKILARGMGPERTTAGFGDTIGTPMIERQNTGLKRKWMASCCFVGDGAWRFIGSFRFQMRVLIAEKFTFTFPRH